MNLKISILAIFSLCLFQITENSSDLECLIIIDDNILPDIREVNIKNTTGDIIELNYKTGRLILSDDSKDRFCQQTEDLILNFTYSQSCYNKLMEYNINLDPELFCQEYFILKVYNFNSFKKGFNKSEGYGYEYYSPTGASLLPKSGKRKLLKKCQNVID